MLHIYKNYFIPEEFANVLQTLQLTKYRLITTSGCNPLQTALNNRQVHFLAIENKVKDKYHSPRSHTENLDSNS